MNGKARTCHDPECDLEVRPYPAGTEFVNASSLCPGTHFMVPDMHGGYARCCGAGKGLSRPPAVFEARLVIAKQFGHDYETPGFRCVACGETTPFDHTGISVAQVVPMSAPK